MAPKSSNKNIVKHIDTVEVGLKFEDDPGNNRTWVDKGRSPEFHYDCNDSQEHSSLTQSSEVQSRVKTPMRDSGTQQQTTFVKLLR